MIGLPPVATGLAGALHRIINRSILDDVLNDLQELKAGKRTCVEANFLFTTACLASAMSIPIATVLALLLNSVVGGHVGSVLGYVVLLSSVTEFVLSFTLMRYYGPTDEVFVPSGGLVILEALLLCLALATSIALSTS